MFRLSILALATGLVTAGSAQAVTFYGDALSFGAAAGPTSAVDLPDVGNVGTGAYAVGPLTFDSLSGDLYLGGAFGSTLIPGHDTAISGVESLRIGMAPSTTSFGFYIHEPTTNTGFVDACNFVCVDSTFTISAYLGAVLVGSTVVNPVDDTANFVGLVDLGGFDRIDIVESTGTADNEFFGGFVVGSSAPAVVPLPAALPLLGGGILGLFAFGRRNRRKS
jgi:hypothetical protein